ncbi:MAG TPA: PEP-CTERM sorting domain-containing protein [Chthoniobacterales bacterium]
MGIAVVSAFLSLQQTLPAAIWTEVGDAGQTVPTAQGTGLPEGTSLSTIFGSIGSANDVDLYRISIQVPSTFSATTVNALTGTSGLDTQLFLFNFNGKSVYANDDDGASMTLQSTLPASNANGPVLVGTYFLAIATSGNEAVDAVNQLLFSPDSPSTGIRTPNGSAGALSSWDNTFGDPSIGAYEIDLTGAFTAVPEPSTWLAAALALSAIFFFRARRIGSRATCAALLLSALIASPLLAVSPDFNADVPDNLGNGLADLVDSNLQLQKAAASGTSIPTFNGYATQNAANFGKLAITDSETGKIVVDIHPSGAYSVNKLLQAIANVAPSFEMTATDSTYCGVGMLEGFVSVDDVAAIANMGGVISVQLGLKPVHHKSLMPGPVIAPQPNAAFTVLGTFFDNGVTQHRVDKISSIYNPSIASGGDGTGMQVGCISDSFATNSTAPTAATNVTNGDLPGAGGAYNTTPVTVLQDFAGGTDEGRGMCQIVYKMAPRANIAFATADIGELSFANNIRALAGIAGFTFPSQTFKADAICDDVGYFDEPFFQDGVIAQGVDAASAAGAAYFSSASNDVDVNGYTAPIRVIPNGTGLTSATNSALVNTNINLTSVPAGLYAGGFHNFDPSGNPANQDVAQTINIAANNATVAGVPTVFQWDDPYDFNAGAVVGAQVYSNSGSITTLVNDASTCPLPTFVQFDNTSTPTPLPGLTAGQGYVLTETATSGNFDARVTIINPDNTVLVPCQDTGVDETVRFTAPQTGNYKFQFGRFGSTTGNFSFVLNEATFTQYVTSNWSLLAFRTDNGQYIAGSSLTANTLATNQPIQLGVQGSTGATIPSLQFVFARSNVPPGPRLPTHFKWTLGANGLGGYGPAEYFTYGTNTTGGHNSATTANGMAAYSVFRPSIPEGFTSPGPTTIYIDQNNVPLPTPDIRLKPNLAAADTANSAWWEAGDSSADVDTVGNFSGTSAAGPHAAAIAALVLQSHGGPGSLTPAQMTSVLQKSTFAHDLDPYYSSVSIKTAGGKVTVSLLSDNSANNGAIAGGTANTVGTGTNDPNAFTVGFAGSGFIKSITFNPNGTAAQGGGVTNGNNGLDATNNYFSNVFPGMVFLPATHAFTLGSLTGLAAGDVTVPLSATPFTGFSNLAPLPSNGTTQFWTMTIGFPNNNFTSGRVVKFGVGRGIQHSASLTGGSGSTGGTTTSNPHGDMFGGGVLIPENTTTTSGMTVSVLMDNNITYTGTMVNRIGAGWSNLDGFGFINAEAASTATP